MTISPIRCTCGLSYRETSSVDVPKQHNTTCAIWLLIEEEDRKRRRHDVLCLVLKVQLEHPLCENGAVVPMTPQQVVERARAVADAAYPPPKEQP